MVVKKFQNFLYFLLVITVIIIDITLFVVIYYRKPSSAFFISHLTEKDTKFVDRVKRALSTSGQVPSKYMEIAEKYNFNHGQLPHPDFDKWNEDEAKLGDLCEFGCAMIRSAYAHNEIKHGEIAEDIIIRIDRELAKVSYMRIEVSTEYGRVNPNKPEFKKFPWGSNWYAFSVRLPRLLLIYEYLGTDDYLKALVCHRNMCRLITTIDTSLEIKRGGVNIVYFALPRVLSNFLFDRQVYETEIKSPEFKKVSEVFEIKINEPDKLQDGLYEDMGYIYHKIVATYSYLFSLEQFYESLYDTFDRPNTWKVFLPEMLSKLLHPTIPYITFGLYGRTNSRIQGNWWGLQGRLGIDLIPSTGLCLFKHQRFMFSIRGQKETIASYESDTSSQSKYALGWIQLRKLYLKDVPYSNNIDATKLKSEPGILSIENENSVRLKSYKNNANAQQYLSKNADSYIGRLMDMELMFWKNEYEFDQVYKTIVMEAGVATENGVEINYTIDNTKESRNLEFRFKDPDVGDDKLKCFIVDDRNNDIPEANGFHVIPAGSKNTFTLRMVFDDSAAKLIHIEQKENMGMVFSLNNNVYKVSYQKRRSDKKFGSYFVVRKYNSLGKNVDIIGGSTTSQMNDRFRETYIGRQIDLIRDRRSTMYLKNPHL